MPRTILKPLSGGGITWVKAHDRSRPSDPYDIRGRLKTRKKKRHRRRGGGISLPNYGKLKKTF